MSGPFVENFPHDSSQEALSVLRVEIYEVFFESFVGDSVKGEHFEVGLAEKYILAAYEHGHPSVHHDSYYNVCDTVWVAMYKS